MKTLSNEMTELRVKALKELDIRIDYLHRVKSEIDYHRACATAWAYWNIGLIDITEVSEYIEKYARIVF